MKFPDICLVDKFLVGCIKAIECILILTLSISGKQSKMDLSRASFLISIVFKGTDKKLTDI